MDATILEGIPLFASLSEEEREQLAGRAAEIDVGAARDLAREGDLAWSFFVICEGFAEVTRDGELLAELGPGDFFGEIGLLLTERRTATVTSITPMRLIVVFDRDFRRFERDFPALAARVRAATAARFPGPSRATSRGDRDRRAAADLPWRPRA